MDVGNDDLCNTCAPDKVMTNEYGSLKQFSTSDRQHKHTAEVQKFSGSVIYIFVILSVITHTI